MDNKKQQRKITEDSEMKELPLKVAATDEPFRPLNNQTNLGSARKPQEGRKIFQYFATFIAGSIMAQSGMNLGWTSPILPQLARNDSFIPNMDSEGTEASWITSLMPLGAIVGAVPSGQAADTFGRRFTIAATSIPFLACWLLMLLASSMTPQVAIPVLYVARFVGGIGAGAAMVLVPVYIGEVAEPKIRGTLGTFFPILFSVGIVYSYIFGSYLSYWAFNFSCCALLAPFLCGVKWLLPESPSWLVQRGHKQEACRVLRRLRGSQYDVGHEVAELLQEHEASQVKQGGIRDLIGTKAGRKALGTCVGLMWFQQMCGIDAVLFYTVQIFQQAESSVDPNIATIVIGFIEVVMGVIVAVTIDRFGRKPLLVFSGSTMTICLGVLGYYYRMMEDNQDVKWLSWLPLTCIGMFNVVFSLGYGSVPYSIISELFPPETKGLASSISIMTNWFLVFVVTRFFHTLTKLLHESVTFWMFACICAMSAVFAFIYVPETKGKTLQEIQTKLARRKNHQAVSNGTAPDPERAEEGAGTSLRKFTCCSNGTSDR